MRVTFAEWAEMTTANAREVCAYVESLHRKIAVLENVIADDLAPEDCCDALNTAVVVAILESRNVPDQH